MAWTMQAMIRGLGLALVLVALAGCGGEPPTTPVIANNNGNGTQQVCTSARDVNCTVTPAPVVVSPPVVVVDEDEE